MKRTEELGTSMRQKSFFFGVLLTKIMGGNVGEDQLSGKSLRFIKRTSHGERSN